MANKQMNQLSTISGVSDSDLLLVYDVSDITSEKTKSILYSDFESTITGNIKSTTLYYNDLIALKTNVDGAIVRDTNSTGPKLLFTGNNDATVGQIYATATNTQLQIGAALETGIKMTYNGATELYYNNSSKLQTTVDGVTMTDGRVDGNLLVSGNFTVSGTTFETQTETVQISDNLLVINYGEVSTGVTKGEAGIEVDRGQAVNYRFMFDETNDYFIVGVSGSEQAVATREDSPTDGYVPYWDASNFQLVNTDSPIKRTTSSGVELYYASEKVFETKEWGFAVVDTAEPSIEFTAGAETVGSVWGSGANDTLNIDNAINSGHVKVLGYTSASSHVSLIDADPDTGVDLYYNGTNTASNNQWGMTLKHSTTPTLYFDRGVTHYAQIWISNSTLVLENERNSGVIKMMSKSSAGADRTLMWASPDTAVWLYYNDSPVFETTADGISLSPGAAKGILYFGAPDSNTSWRITDADGDLQFQRRVAGVWVTKYTINQ